VTPIELVVFYQAIVDGGVGQVQHEDGKWNRMVSGPNLYGGENKYRIKPKPVERWGIIVDDKFYSTTSSKEEALVILGRMNIPSRVFLMREVEDD